MRMPIYFHPLHEGDYPKLLKLWAAAGQIDVRETDTQEAFARFLKRNPGTNFAAYAGTRLVGAVLAGHDGWRGYLYRMAIKPDYRERGIASRLVNAAVGNLRKEGISRVHLLVKKDNLIGQQFWEACGFNFRDNLLDFSIHSVSH